MTSPGMAITPLTISITIATEPRRATTSAKLTSCTRLITRKQRPAGPVNGYPALIWIASTGVAVSRPAEILPVAAESVNGTAGFVGADVVVV